MNKLSTFLPPPAGHQPTRTSRCDTCLMDRPVTGPIYRTCDLCLNRRGYLRGPFGWYLPRGAFDPGAAKGNNGGTR